MLCHNHYSGSLKPSNEDIGVTKQLLQVGNIISSAAHDHVVISTRLYVNLHEKRERWEEIVNDIKYKPQYMIKYETDLTT